MAHHKRDKDISINPNSICKIFAWGTAEFALMDPYSFSTIPFVHCDVAPKTKRHEVIGCRLLRREYPPCHLVWPPVPWQSWPSIVLRRARIVPDGTNVEALAIINYGHNTTSHRTRVVSTTRRDIHPNTGVLSHDPAPLGNILFPSLRTGFHKIRNHPRKLSRHASSTKRRLPLVMNRVLQSNQFTSRQILQINYCRLFLRVHTVSDLATALGTHIDVSLFSGQPSLLSSTSTEHEIRQERPNTAAAWAFWRKSCSMWCDIKSGK
jgi:hypothetical protein